MAKPSAAEMKRIKAALKRRALIAGPMMGLRRRPRQLLPGSLDQDALKRLQAVLDLDKIKKINKSRLKKLRGLLDKRPHRDKSDATVLKSLRRAIQERRRAARRVSVGASPPGQITRVYLDTPFMIQANKPEWLLDSQIESFNSTAQAQIQYIDTIPTDDNSALDSVRFLFAWHNDTGPDAEVQNCTSLLAVKGQGAGQA